MTGETTTRLEQKQTIVFRTSNNWTVSEFVAFLANVSELYNALFLLDIFTASARKSQRDKDMIRRVLIEGPAFGFLKPRSWEGWISLEYALRIDAIDIASPGTVKLSGVAHIIRELRELIKDISYRNVSEKKLVKLEVIEKQIQILKSTGFSENEIRSLLSHLDQHLEEIDQLRLRGNISEIE